MRLCNARTSSGGLCRQPAPRGRSRCFVHAGRPPGTPQHPNTRAAAIEGRRRRLERMKVAKAAGLIGKIPGGRRPGVRGRIRSPDPRSARLERMAERTIDEMLVAIEEG